MSKGLNRIQIIGHVGRDPEMRYTPGGQAVTEFSVAVSHKRKDGTDDTLWLRVICWSKLAEIADQYVKKGSRVYVEGRLQVRKYSGNDGQERTAVEVVTNDLILLDSRSEAREPVRAGADDFDDLPF